MAKLDRVHQKIFASTAPSSDVGIIGSLHEGTPTESTSVQDIQSLAAFENGIRSIVIGENSPIIEEDNALYKLITHQLAYLFQNGIAEWVPEVEYQARSIVKHGATLYQMTDIVSTNQEPGTIGTPWQAFYLAPILMPSNYLPRVKMQIPIANTDGTDYWAASQTDGLYTEILSVSTQNRQGVHISFQLHDQQDSSGARIDLSSNSKESRFDLELVKSVAGAGYETVIHRFSLDKGGFMYAPDYLAKAIPASSLNCQDYTITPEEEGGAMVTYTLRGALFKAGASNASGFVWNTAMIVRPV